MRPLRLLAVAALYFAAARAALTLALVNKQITAVWPPTGIALAALVLGGYRLWPGIALGAFLVNVHAGTAAAACGIAAGNALEALTGALVLRRFFAFDPSLRRLSDVFGLLVAALVSSMVSATIGTASLGLGGMGRVGHRSPWFVWWLGDVLGALIAAPAIMTWAARPRPPWRGRKLAELGLMFAALLAAGDAVFSRVFFAPYTSPPRFLMFPFLIWAAVRFGQPEVAAVNLAVAGFAVWGALREGGPGLNENLNTAQLFMGVFAATGLVLGAAMTERRTAEAELESRVARRTAELAQRNSELLRSKEETEAFIHAVTHDLRGPLANIRGYIREMGAETNGLAEALRFINASVERIQRLIDAMLQFSRAGRQDYRFQDLDVGLLVGATLDSLRQSLKESGARVEVGVLPPAFGDSTAVARIFSNLIENAAHFLQPGRPGLIEISGESGGGMSRYRVKDNGIGVSEADIPRLFRVFQRLSPAAAPGEGIGLATIKRIVERHGGTIWAESRGGAGAEFHFTLPEKRSGEISPGGTHHDAHPDRRGRSLHRRA
jgi:signal transduction histidine kinase